MLTYGSDRSRTAGGKVILQSSYSKGWTARTTKTASRGEHPGTAVQWGEETFEVISADVLPGGGVRYVLAPWPDNEAIRVIQSYDEESEARRIADLQAAHRQQQTSVVTRLSGMFLGHLPAVVQNHLGNAYGATPSRMTLLSLIPCLVFIAICALMAVGGTIDKQPSRVPIALLLFAGYVFLESVIRFQIAMSQSRGVGSALGLLIYLLIWMFAPKRLVSPFATERGNATFTLPPPDDVALRDSLETRGVLLSLLTRAEQTRLAQRLGYNYRRHGPSTAWIFLAGSTLGVVSSLAKGVVVPSIVAAIIAMEQVLRLIAMRRGPAGSMFGPIARLFVRDLLAR